MQIIIKMNKFQMTFKFFKIKKEKSIQNSIPNNFNPRKKILNMKNKIVNHQMEVYD